VGDREQGERRRKEERLRTRQEDEQDVEPEGRPEGRPRLRVALEGGTEPLGEEGRSDPQAPRHRPLTVELELAVPRLAQLVARSVEQLAQLAWPLGPEPVEPAPLTCRRCVARLSRVA
jgi:hypothetical protein